MKEVEVRLRAEVKTEDRLEVGPEAGAHHSTQARDADFCGGEPQRCAALLARRALRQLASDALQQRSGGGGEEVAKAEVNEARARTRSVLLHALVPDVEQRVVRRARAATRRGADVTREQPHEAALEVLAKQHVNGGAARLRGGGRAQRAEERLVVRLEELRDEADERGARHHARLQRGEPLEHFHRAVLRDRSAKDEEDGNERKNVARLDGECVGGRRVGGARLLRALALGVLVRKRSAHCHEEAHVDLRPFRELWHVQRQGLAH